MHFIKERNQSKKSVKVKPKRKRIEFSFDAPDASKVFLAGDFNEWNIKKHPMASKRFPPKRKKADDGTCQGKPRYPLAATTGKFQKGL